ncbi:probable JmjC domain-containing histone demethylation protein 2C isoform X2 [Wyeomyia smithii]|uniref:probable JmjC domain-containing histone demethylation protein 2C isoform X2 n=1 Tax=Wyeomyia smithii TaxID=174621 RepID=UPI002467FE24|nr:probable JmjC domain-containing histone demethylation protein 2C isoform X2 [Wyeomyia smithii]
MSDKKKQFIVCQNINSDRNRSFNSVQKSTNYTKKTFEEAYRDALIKLNVAAIDISETNRCHPNQNTSSVKNNIACGFKTTVMPINSIFSTPLEDLKSSNESYRTTIYNINTINLVEMLKHQGQQSVKKSENFGKSVPIGKMAKTTSDNTLRNVMAESCKYRQTFSNAFAKHLLEQTKYAIDQVVHDQDVLKTLDSEEYRKINSSISADNFPYKYRDMSIQIQLKPSLIQIAHQKMYNQLVRRTPNRSLRSFDPILSGDPPQSLKPPQSLNTNFSTSSTRVMNIIDGEYATKMCIGAKKLKISSPAPNQVYDKPTITTASSTSSTGHFVTRSNKTIFVDHNTSVDETDMEPPPAHSTIRIKSTSSSSTLNSLQFLHTEKPEAHTSFNNRRVNQNHSVICEPALNLDTKISMPMNTTLHSDTSLSKSVSPQLICMNVTNRPISIGQNTNKIAKFNNYHNSINKSTSLNTFLSQNHCTKIIQQTNFKQSRFSLNGNFSLSEQKTKLLELLKNANTQKIKVNVQDKTQFSRQPVFLRYKNIIKKTTLEMKTNYIENMSKFRIHKKQCSLLIEPRTLIKRKDQSNPKSSKSKRKRVGVEYYTEPYLQNGPCYQVAPKLPRCRECGRSAAVRSRASANVFCRFIAFRKLKYDHEGLLQVVGFANPSVDPQDFDTSLWNANFTKVPSDLSVEKSKFLLGQVGYKFCELFHQEEEAYYEHMSEGIKVTSITLQLPSCEDLYCIQELK